MECPRCSSGNLRVVRTVRGETLTPPKPFIDYRRQYCTECRIFFDTITQVVQIHKLKNSNLKTQPVKLDLFIKLMESY